MATCRVLRRGFGCGGGVAGAKAVSAVAGTGEQPPVSSAWIRGPGRRASPAGTCKNSWHLKAIRPCAGPRLLRTLGDVAVPRQSGAI